LRALRCLEVSFLHLSGTWAVVSCWTLSCLAKRLKCGRRTMMHRLARHSKRGRGAVGTNATIFGSCRARVSTDLPVKFKADKLAYSRQPASSQGTGGPPEQMPTGAAGRQRNSTGSGLQATAEACFAATYASRARTPPKLNCTLITMQL
jgi:hypothetical protein